MLQNGMFEGRVPIAIEICQLCCCSRSFLMRFGLQALRAYWLNSKSFVTQPVTLHSYWVHFMGPSLARAPMPCFCLQPRVVYDRKGGIVRGRRSSAGWLATSRLLAFFCVEIWFEWIKSALKFWG